MTIDAAKSFIFQQTLTHTCVVEPIYVINGSATKQNKPVDFSGYLIMVNANGDTIAGCSPGCPWKMYPAKITGTHPGIAKHPHAIHIP